MLSIAVLTSTKATVLQPIIDAIEKKQLNAKISVVISDKQDAYALERAKKHAIPSFFIDPKQFRHLEGKELQRESFDRGVFDVFHRYGVELILLIGYMKIVSPFLIKQYPNRIMNIHPSLLPDFAGIADMDVHAAVLKAKMKKSGCTLHFVSERLDSGPIIMQQEVLIDKNETADTLKAKVQKAEQQILIRTIQLYSEGKITLKGDKVLIGE